MEEPAGRRAATLPAPRWLADDRTQRALRGFTACGAFYFVQQRLWPAPLGVVVNGMVLGALTALIAFSVVGRVSPHNASCTARNRCETLSS